MLTELQGQIERITYSNEQNGFTIAKVKVAGRRELVTVSGNFLAPTPGEVLKMTGEWINHPRYGHQFKVVQFESQVPASVHGIQKYLGSGLIKGIGPVMAQRIVEMFGEKTLNVIEEQLRRLGEVQGIGKKRIEMIEAAWEAQKEIRELMLFLQSFGVGSGHATKIFKHYGRHSIEVLRENPYRLATDILGIGFVTADHIAGKLGIEKDSELRAEAGALYVLRELAGDGHVYYPYDPLLKKCQEILQVDPEVIGKALEAVVADNQMVIETPNQDSDRSGANDKVYLAQLYLCETSSAQRLKSLVRTPKCIRKIDTDRAVQWVQNQLAITLVEKQIEAVRSALEDKVMVITGGPGTGKTTIISAVLKIFARLGVRILLAAPTGRAAKRMKEATGHEAGTIHRMLEYSIQKGGFQRNQENPLRCDLLIVDEASMIDTVLMHHLLKAIPPGATFILVGDVNQLPSVGPGNVLRDMIVSGAVGVVELSQIFRQAEESSIIVNAHRINRGQLPLLSPSGRKLNDFYFIEQEDPQEVLKLILELARERIPRRFGLLPLDDIQVLTPMQKGVVGVGNLNLELQRTFNPAGKGISRLGSEFRVNDKVMQIRNNYEKEIFNGDIGRIERIDSESQEVIVRFDHREVLYDYTDLDEISLAYAVSVHKSQGSEYPAIIVPVLMQHYRLLQRNLIYTAVTRGRKLVVIVGTKKALAIGVKNDRIEKRYSSLHSRL